MCDFWFVLVLFYRFNYYYYDYILFIWATQPKAFVYVHVHVVWVDDIAIVLPWIAFERMNEPPHFVAIADKCYSKLVFGEASASASTSTTSARLYWRWWWWWWWCWMTLHTIYLMHGSCLGDGMNNSDDDNNDASRHSKHVMAIFGRATLMMMLMGWWRCAMTFFTSLSHSHRMCSMCASGTRENWTNRIMMSFIRFGWWWLWDK